MLMSIIDLYGDGVLFGGVVGGVGLVVVFVLLWNLCFLSGLMYGCMMLFVCGVNWVGMVVDCEVILFDCEIGVK